MELLFTVGIQGGQLAAADRLHDPDGDMMLFQQLVFLPGPLDGPVQIVQLDLTELHLLAIALQKSGEAGKVRVGGKAQVLDAAQTLLLHKVVDDAPLGVGVDIHIVFIDVVQQVEIEVVHLTLLQLLGKGVRRVRVAGERMAGVFGGQVKAVPGMLFQAAAYHRLGQILHIGPGGVEIIDAVGQRIVHHRLGGVLVDGAVHRGGQAHGAEAQQGQVQVLKITIDHIVALLFVVLLYREKWRSARVELAVRYACAAAAPGRGPTA